MNVPALFHEVIDKRVEHENDENSNKDVVDRPDVADLQQFTAQSKKRRIASLGLESEAPSPSHAILVLSLQKTSQPRMFPCPRARVAIGMEACMAKKLYGPSAAALLW